MWHTLENVARNQRVDYPLLRRLALSNRVHYGLDDHDMISTWSVNELLDDYKTTIPAPISDLIVCLENARDILGLEGENRLVEHWQQCIERVRELYPVE